MTTIPEIWQEIEKIHERNRRVEENKAWETSGERKILIVLLTYLVIVLFFYVANIASPWVNAIVPSLGFFLSTLTVPFVKNLWIHYRYKK